MAVVGISCFCENYSVGVDRECVPVAESDPTCPLGHRSHLPPLLPFPKAGNQNVPTNACAALKPRHLMVEKIESLERALMPGSVGVLGTLKYKGLSSREEHNWHNWH